MSAPRTCEARLLDLVALSTPPEQAVENCFEPVECFVLDYGLCLGCAETLRTIYGILGRLAEEGPGGEADR